MTATRTLTMTTTWILRDVPDHLTPCEIHEAFTNFETKQMFNGSPIPYLGGVMHLFGSDGVSLPPPLLDGEPIRATPEEEANLQLMLKLHKT